MTSLSSEIELELVLLEIQPLDETIPPIPMPCSMEECQEWCEKVRQARRVMLARHARIRALVAQKGE